MNKLYEQNNVVSPSEHMDKQNLGHSHLDFMRTKASQAGQGVVVRRGSKIDCGAPTSPKRV